MDSFSSFQKNYDDPYLFNNPISTPFLNDSKYYDLPSLFSSEEEFNYNSENNIDDNFSSFWSPGINNNLLSSPINEYNVINDLNDDKDSENNIKGIPFKPNIPIEVRTTSVTTKMPVNHEIISNTTSKIFEIKKEKKFLGGKRKRNIIYIRKAKHTKFEKKNILTKIKKKVYNNYLKLINKNIKDSPDEEIKKRKIKLRKINNSMMEVSSKKDNLELLEMKMKDILSQPLSDKFKNIDKNYNKKEIDFILKKKDKKLTSILNKRFDEVIRKYAYDLIDKDFDDFKSLKDDIKNMEDETYIEEYKKYAKSVKINYIDIKERAPRGKKKLINWLL
jgi:hypothetical protein